MGKADGFGPDRLNYFAILCPEIIDINFEHCTTIMCKKDNGNYIISHNEDDDYKEKLINKPATPGSHHFFKGGLLFHIYSVTKNAIAICDLYPNLNVDKDLIVFEALVHDIGKCNNFNDFSDSENYNSINGNSMDLLGHSYEGAHIVENYLKNYDIDEQFKNQVIHMIGSHMNEYSEWGALVLPKMLEVIIINYADSMDA